MMPKKEEIPFKCKICKHLIEHYYTGELICNFEDGVNPNLISDCDEFKIGKLRLVEFLQERDKRIETLESIVFPYFKFLYNKLYETPNQLEGYGDLIGEIMLKIEQLEGIKLNEFVEMNLDKKIILESINELSELIPIEWDRIIEGKDYLIVFGWIPNIKRDDFVTIIFREDYYLYFTSSVEYTRKMSENWNCIEKHSDCIKFKKYFKKELEGKPE